jgi:hypothetical protein
LKGEENLPERDVVIEWNGAPWPPKEMKAYSQPMRAIVTPEGWKMILAPDGYGTLYNLKQDPEERTNLFYRKSSLDLIQMLTHRLHLWQTSTGDTLIPFDPKEWESLSQKFSAQAVS